MEQQIRVQILGVMGGANPSKGVGSFSRRGPRWCDGRGRQRSSVSEMAPKDVGGRQDGRTKGVGSGLAGRPSLAC